MLEFQLLMLTMYAPVTIWPCMFLCVNLYIPIGSPTPILLLLNVNAPTSQFHWVTNKKKIWYILIVRTQCKFCQGTNHFFNTPSFIIQFSVRAPMSFHIFIYVHSPTSQFHWATDEKNYGIYSDCKKPSVNFVGALISIFQCSYAFSNFLSGL